MLGERGCISYRQYFYIQDLYKRLGEEYDGKALRLKSADQARKIIGYLRSRLQPKKKITILPKYAWK